MHSEVKIYKLKDLIRANKEGEIDLDRSKRIIHELAATAAFHEDHNILVDFRDAIVTTNSMSDLLDLCIEMARFKAVFKNKMATVISNEEEQITSARRFKECLKIKGFQFEFFTDFEKAIEWLSDTTRLDTSGISAL